MKFSKLFLLASLLSLSFNTQAAPDVVRLGNLKFAHYGAVFSMYDVLQRDEEESVDYALA